MKAKVTSKLMKRIHFSYSKMIFLIYDFCTLQLICVVVIFYTLDSTTTRAGNYDDLRRFSGQYLDVNTKVITGLHLIKVAFQHISGDNE